ncbi:hypothetical protein KUCAC02_017465, partial [Chaenocephalus aceratus]
LLSSSHYMSFIQSMRFTVLPLPIHNLAFPFVSVLLTCNSITTLHLPSCSKASVTPGSPPAHTQTSRLVKRPVPCRCVQEREWEAPKDPSSSILSYCLRLSAVPRDCVSPFVCSASDWHHVMPRSLAQLM